MYDVLAMLHLKSHSTHFEHCNSRNFQGGFKLGGDNRSLSRVAAAFSRSGIEPSPIALSSAAITTPDMLGLRKRSEK